MISAFNANLAKSKITVVTIMGILKNECKIIQENMPNDTPYIIPIEKLITDVSNGYYRVKNISLLKRWYTCNNVINTIWCDGESFEDWEEANEDTKKYEELHGVCHEFALQHSKVGDKYIVWLTQNEEVGRLTLIHCFIQRDDVFIDTRGATRNKKAVYEGFEDWDIVRELVFETKEKFKNFLKQFGVIDE